MRMLLVNLLFVSSAVVLSAPPVSARTPVGYVLEVKGEWYLNGDYSRALRRWQKLPPEGTVSIKSPTPADRIVIARLNGEIIDKRSCDADLCSRPIKLQIRV